MRLIKTTFNNFRCFKQYEIDYGTETTVFIGKNGAGKSSVLSGIRRGLSFMFAKPKNFQRNLATSNNATVKSFDKLEANFDASSRSYTYPIQNDFVAFFDSKKLDWSLEKASMNGGLLTTKYYDALSNVLERYNEDANSSLPVLAVITDSFPHQEINVGSKAKKIITQDLLPRDLGYYGWDERTNCTQLWLRRFYKVFNFERDLKNDIEQLEEQIFLYEKRIGNRDEHDKHHVPDWEDKIGDLKENLSYLRADKRSSNFSKERDFILEKLLLFTKPLQKEYDFINEEFELFRISVTRPDDESDALEFSFKDGRIMTFKILPMGYKRIFSAVIDIAYRSYILNENNESEGVVLIDEIELHLHPTLQQEILQRLRVTFPKIQFIVTTHSPLVISNFKSDDKNKIVKLEQRENDYFNTNVENIYGIDYKVGLTEVMGATHRKSEIDKLIDSVVILKKFGNEAKANEIQKELVKMVGPKNKHISDEINKRIVQNK